MINDPARNAKLALAGRQFSIKTGTQELFNWIPHQVRDDSLVEDDDKGVRDDE